ncbi:CpaF family protein [Anaeromyxobacter oryzae]|uniref:Type II/IV secretion system-related protein n=1 Tax=Anaeromyxobacter oryzae TaxID=2918170 RepID=A0ABM7WP24_9BACT|nr:CpaF family protein [Anaeromyxobacter oryzae]BDG01208.1 type II/IV secretion system-related protein [Anaeromyxobacter oryzae]
MRLSDRIRQGPGSTPEPSGPEAAPESFREVKSELHRRLIDRLDLKAIEKLPSERLRADLRGIVSGMVGSSGVPLNQLERERLIQEILDEVTGLGPLEPLLADPSISDILVNTGETVYIERAGKLELTRVRFDSNDHLMQVINRIVSRVGRRVDETSPMVDARLQDGSRVNAIIPPLAIDGPILSIRRFGRSPLTARDLLAHGSINREALSFLAACVRAKLNVLISGGTGTGKTTMLNALSVFIPEDERIVTIEDSAELQLQQPHIVRLESRPPNIEGKGEIVARDLVRNALRMRPDRIVVGEVRGAEVLDMLQAMNTGHEGSMTTIHANSPRDALTRIEAMVGMAGITLSETAARQMISRALNVIVQLSRGTDGVRRLASVSELTGMEGPVVVMQEIFKFEQRGVDEHGKVLGHLGPTGVRPKVLSRIERFGIDLATVLEPVLGA